LRKDMNMLLTRKIVSDFEGQDLSLVAYKKALLANKARQRELVVQAIRACPKGNVLQSNPKIWQKQFAHSDASLERWQEQVVEGCRKSDHFLFKPLESLYSTPVCIVAPM
jgi:hypothetical protein